MNYELRQVIDSVSAQSFRSAVSATAVTNITKCDDT